MTANEIMDRFSQTIPIATMTRGLVEYLFSPTHLNSIPQPVQLFTYTRSIEFAQLVTLMADVVFRVHPSVRAAYRHSPEAQATARLKSFYEKFNHLEPAVCQAFVQQMTQRCVELVDALGDPAQPVIPGLRPCLLDGNKLAATQRRLDGLEEVYAPLPGQALVLQDAQTRLFLEVLPCEDAYTNERALFASLSGWWKANDLIVADANFCTELLLRQIAGAEAFFVIRHHSTVGLHPDQPEQPAGRNASGSLFEQQVRYAQTDLHWRCVIVRLDQPTRDGDREIRILTNLTPEQAEAGLVATIYLQRRGIENSFQELEAAFRSEIDTLAYPKAALFGFCLGLVLCNLFQMIRATVSRIENAPDPQAISGVLLGQELSTYLGTLLLLELPSDYPQADWTAPQMADWLRQLAGPVCWERYHKSPRGPKKNKQFDREPKRSAHQATARVLDKRSNRYRSPPGKG